MLNHESSVDLLPREPGPLKIRRWSQQRQTSLAAVHNCGWQGKDGDANRQYDIVHTAQTPGGICKFIVLKRLSRVPLGTASLFSYGRAICHGSAHPQAQMQCACLRSEHAVVTRNKWRKQC